MKHHISSDIIICGSPSQSIPLVGYRFHPTDDELLTHFLQPKMSRHIDYQPLIPEVKVCDYEPWDLPALINTNSNDQVWYFFCPRDYKYLHSRRSNRTTKAGYWKSTGKHRKGDFVLCKLKSKADEKIHEGKTPADMVLESDIENQKLNEMTVNASCDEHESNDKLKTKADEQINEGKPIDMVLESNIENQNLNEMTVNSSCDEHELSIRISSQSNHYNPNEMTIMSNHEEEGEWTWLLGIDCENQNIEDVTTNKSGDVDTSYNYLGSDIGNETPHGMDAMSTSINGKLSDFECQNPYQETDISASEEGEWSPYGPTLADASNSTTTNNNVSEVDPLISYINELELVELAKLIEEEKYNSAFYQLPISPNQSSSYSSFGLWC